MILALEPFAAAASEESIARLLGSLAALLIAARLLGEAAQRLGQPSVLGELLAGILLGPSLLGIIDPASPVMHTLGELGIVILLFQIGLHTNLKDILAVGMPATVVGVVGVVVPFASGYFVAIALGLDGVTAVVCGAALTATSIGISARVLSDLGQLETIEGRIVLGAAVLDDVVGLIILSIVSELASGGAISAVSIGQTTALAIGFLAVALVVGRLVAPGLMRVVSRLRVDGAIGSIALAFAFALAALASVAGSALIIGAFAAGLVLHTTPEARRVEKATTTLGHFFVPAFFVAVGASIDLRTLGDTRVLLIGGALSLVAVLGKLVSGYTPFWLQARKTMIGVAMIPRGEVGLIFAQMGLLTGTLDPGLFSAVVLMVMVTTFIAPPWLAAIAGRSPSTPDTRGIDELVYGTDDK
ncbi:MAG TPA: cation:proton antiporter [Gemmatimonadales bacterium]|nr:cation:proton antiporter [Gemmatimonadales bacterium]